MISRFLTSLVLLVLIVSCGRVETEKVNKAAKPQNNDFDFTAKLDQLNGINNTDSLREIALSYSSLLEKNKQHDSVKSNFYSQLGVIYYQKALFENAELAFGMAQNSYVLTGDSSRAVHMQMNRAAMMEIGGQYDKAVEQYIEVIDFFERHSDSIQLGNAFSNLGVAYEEMEQGEKSMEYHKKALGIRLKIGDTLNIAYSYNNIGVLFMEIFSVPDSALYYYQKADLIFKETNALYQSATVSTNIGHIFLEKQDFNKAKVNFDFALKVFESLDITQGKANMLRSFGQLYFATGEDAKAISSLQKSMELNQQQGNQKEVLEISSILSKIYFANGNYIQAAKTMRTYSQLNDSLLNIDKQKAIADMETKYQVKEKNKTIEMLRLEEELKSKQIKARNVLIVLLFVIFALIIAIFYFSQQKNKLNQKQLRLELQNYLLRMDELQNKIDSKENCPKFSEEKLKDFDLSGRETDVLKLIAQGYRNSEIAEKLFVSQNTIKTHIKNIYLKLDVKNRIQVLKKIDIV